MIDYKPNNYQKHNAKPTVEELVQSIIFFAVILSVMFLPGARELLIKMAGLL